LKIGISSYSLNSCIESGEMDIGSAIRWIAEQGAEHVEIVPLSAMKERMKDGKYVAEIRRAAEEAGLELSNYAVGGNFAGKDDAAFAGEIARIKEQVDIAHALGVKRMRHADRWRNARPTGSSGICPPWRTPAGKLPITRQGTGSRPVWKTTATTCRRRTGCCGSYMR